MKSQEKILMQKIARREKMKRKLKNKPASEEINETEGKTREHIKIS
jgi:predicted transcriptional regulator